MTSSFSRIFDSSSSFAAFAVASCLSSDAWDIWVEKACVRCCRLAVESCGSTSVMRIADRVEHGCHSPRSSSAARESRLIALLRAIDDSSLLDEATGVVNLSRLLIVAEDKERALWAPYARASRSVSPASRVGLPSFLLLTIIIPV